MVVPLSPDAEVTMPPPVPVSALRTVTLAGGVSVVADDVRAAQYDSSSWPGPVAAKVGVVNVAVVTSFTAPTAV